MNDPFSMPLLLKTATLSRTASPSTKRTLFALSRTTRTRPAQQGPEGRPAERTPTAMSWTTRTAASRPRPGKRQKPRKRRGIRKKKRRGIPSGLLAPCRLITASSSSVIGSDNLLLCMLADFMSCKLLTATRS